MWALGKSPGGSSPRMTPLKKAKRCAKPKGQRKEGVGPWEPGGRRKKAGRQAECGGWTTAGPGMGRPGVKSPLSHEANEVVLGKTQAGS